MIPTPDSVRLTARKAHVSLTAGYAPGPDVTKDVLAHTRARLTPGQLVRRIEFADPPKAISEKIRRAELRGP